MPKKSQKSKSKRLTLRAKHKVIRKVKEHQRKKRKEAKKSGHKDKGPKDPGLPSQWPFKEDLVKEFAMQRAKILADEQKKKDEKKARRLAAKQGGAAEEGQDMDRLQAAALSKEADFETRKRARLVDDENKPGGDKDNSRKSFYREFKKVVEIADVIIQVLDARDPLACRCPDVERYIRATNPSKRIILLLNKMDLVPREVGEKWLKYFREELPTVAFKCSTQQQAERIGQRKMPSSKRPAKGGSSEDGLQTSACLGADTLIQLLKNYCRNAGIKTSITVGVVGLPNVGKSSLINSLKRARVAQVGNTPGVTKSVQEVHLDKNIKLLDSPGIVFTSATEEGDNAAVLRNCIKVEKLEDPVGPIGEILKRVPARQLMSIYKIPSFTEPGTSETEKFLQLVATARGKLKKGGVPDMRAAARVILQDWNDGRIPYFTVPPSRGNEEFQQAAVVGVWAKEFNADEVFATEKSAVIAHLPSMDDDMGAGPSGRGAEGGAAAGPRSFFQLESVGQAKLDLAAMEQSEEEEEGSEEDGMDGDGDSMDDDGEDDEEYGAKPSKKKLRQTEGIGLRLNNAAVLYGEDGQVNPHAKRAEKKAAKKASKAAVASGVVPAAKGAAAAKGKQQMDEDEGSDFEFEEDDDEEEGESEEGSEGEGEEEEGSEEMSD